jgi:hypothetical protein
MVQQRRDLRGRCQGDGEPDGEIRFHLDPQAQAMKNADAAIGFGKDSEIV